MSGTPAYVARITPPLDVASERHLSVTRASVLVVDDEESNLRLLRRILTRAGFTEIRATTDPRQVAALVADAEPDVVLLDLHMPGRDGFEVLEDLAPLTRGTGSPGGPLPVIMLTADASPAVKRQALALGAKDFVAKPFDVPEIVLRIHNLLETRELHRALWKQNAALETTVQERTRALEDSQAEMLARLAAASEFRDDDTGQHTQRVGESAAQLAAALGLAASQVELIRHAAPLHDVGKIGVPDSILLKPGKLTPEELAIMQTHTTVGAAMLAGGRTPLVQMSERIARSHHERWDGTGYPDGLAGVAIPLEARLVAVADVFDALTSDRPYRRAWTMDRVVAHMRDGAGSHFDPAIVDAFLRVTIASDADGRHASD